MRKNILVCAAALSLAMTPALAQDGGEPELANKDWYSVVFIDFHEGKTQEAMKLIESFMKVDETLGREGPMAMHMDTGEWDMMVAFKMEGGIAEMGWASNPRNDEWNAELARQLGGEEQAAAHWSKYLALVKESRTEIAHVNRDWGS